MPPLAIFSISFLLVSTAILPLNMIIPVLFDTWSKKADQKYNMESYLKLSHLGTLIAIIGFGVGIVLIEPVTRLVFGLEFLPSVLSTQILLLSVYALYQSRLLAAMFTIDWPSSGGGDRCAYPGNYYYFSFIF